MAVSPITSPNQLLITVNKGGTVVTVTVQMLARALTIMLRACLGTGHIHVFTSPSQKRGGRAAKAAHRAGAAHVNIKRHAMYASEAFWSM